MVEPLFLSIFSQTNITMVQIKLYLTCVFFTQALSAPFLFNVPEALTSLVSSASAASSDPFGNIADLTKPNKLQDDDDFFKQDQEESPNLLRQKLDKVVQKIRFLATLTNSGDDAFQKEQDDFDKEFNADFTNEELVQDGYFYDKPMDVKSAKQKASNGISFNPANIGVFFMELIGSLVGLAYGAAAQLNYPGSTTTASPAEP